MAWELQVSAETETKRCRFTAGWEMWAETLARASAPEERLQVHRVRKCSMLKTQEMLLCDWYIQRRRNG